MRELRTVGYLDVRGNAVTTSNRASILFEVPPGETWEVSRMAIRCRSSVLTSRLDVYIGEEQDTNLIDGSNSGNLDFADNSAPYLITGGQTLRLVWTNADNNVVCTAHIQGKVGKVMESRGIAPEVGQVIDSMPTSRRAPLRKKVTAGFGGGGW